MPYLVLALGAVLWRTLFFEYQTHNYQFNFMDTLRQAPGHFRGIGRHHPAGYLADGRAAWLQTLHLPEAVSLGRQTALIAWGLLLI